LKAGTLATEATWRGALTAVLFVARAASAQRIEGSLDLGGAALRYADTLSTRAANITPHLTASWPTAFLDAAGTYSQFTSGGWSTQGSLSASRFVLTRFGLFGEVSGFAGGSTHNDGTRTGEVIVNTRAHFPRSGSELFFGIGAGRTWDGVERRNLVVTEAGASIGSGSTSALFTVSPTMVGDSIKYADSQASVSWTREAVDLAAVVGFRVGDQLTTLGGHARAWGNVSAGYRITPRFGVVAAGGSYPVDPTQGFPGGKFVSFSLRLTRATRQSPPSASDDGPVLQARDVAPAGSMVPTGFAAKRERGGALTLRVNAPGAKAVEISGDFTNWTPLQLVRAEKSWWVVSLPITRGNYQMNVRVDGGRWVVPPGLLSMVDEFGGAVGLLVVE
jgi:Glycogen recognition site of AMP-activated protein kinase